MGENETRLTKNIKMKLSDKNALRTIVQLLGNMESKRGLELMEAGGFPMPGGGVKMTQMMAVVQAQMNKAIEDGDTSAATWLRDTGWGKPGTGDDMQSGSGERSMAISADILSLLQDKARERVGDVKRIDATKEEDVVDLKITEDGKIILGEILDNGEERK